MKSMKDTKKPVEIKAKRTAHSKTFYHGNGKYTLAANRAPMHYEDAEGNWRTIDMSIQDGIIDRNVFRAELLTDAIGYSVTSKVDGGRIDVKLCKIGNVPIPYSTPVIEGRFARWNNILPNVDFHIEFRARRVRCWKTLKDDDAPKDITFEVFEDDEDSQHLALSTKYVGRDKKGRATVSAFDSSREVKSKSRTTGKRIKARTIVETFTGRVVNVDKTTRVRSEAKPEYPVVIDADVEVTVDESGGDGMEWIQKSVKSSTGTVPITEAVWIEYSGNFLTCNWLSTTIYSLIADIKSGSYCIFDGISIPQHSEIESAVLNIYAAGTTEVLPRGVVAPDPASSMIGTITETSGFLFRTFLSPFAFPKVDGTLHSISAGTLTYDMSTTEISSLCEEQNIDVTSIVQELVMTYDYTSPGSMCMLLHKAVIETTKGTNLFENNVRVYAYDLGPTKAPELLIDYTSHEPTTGSWVKDLGNARVQPIPDPFEN